jgi:hypothetical protein
VPISGLLNNGNLQSIQQATITDEGVVAFMIGSTANGFTASGAKGIYPTTFMYNIGV